MSSPESMGPHEIPVRSRHGIRYMYNTLYIPKEVVQGIGGKDVIGKNLHPRIFDGAHPLRGTNHDDSYSVEFLSGTPMEKLQALIDAIEDLYDKNTEK